VLIEKHDAIKVSFGQSGGPSVWLKVLVHDCGLKVESG
jgi:hypothetical protein